jgi:hypothetical protein
MQIDKVIYELRKLGACADAVKDAEKYNTAQEFWEKCNRGDWMLWLLFKILKPLENELVLRKITSIKVKCVRLVQHLISDKRSLVALDISEKFSKGEATRKELDAAAAAAADAAAYAADAGAAYAAAYAAVYAADAAAYAADAGAYAAAAAADAAYYDAAYDAAANNRKSILKQCSEIVRETYLSIDEILDNVK